VINKFGVQYFGSIQFRRRGVEHSSFVTCGVRSDFDDGKLL